ncbi:MAG TPA: Holliday junction branch migration protein RuvA [Acidimicrobiales bacterium]|jgi:Holliday junction DNA helicase RuvA|nr:Holliday junction branch migration protein RuvA [Acidimicrobiales bacterium]
MIGSLRGTLLDRSSRGEVVVEVGGVGYRATVAPPTLAALGEPGGTVLLHTHLHVREDALTLFGFATRDERDCFEALIGAHGVGPALALAILSVHHPSDLRRVLADGDLDALTLVPGVGRKTAARLLIELRSRLDAASEEVAVAVAVTEGNGNGAGSVRADVREALVALGYDADQVRPVLRELPADGEVQDLLRAALRLLSAGR